MIPNLRRWASLTLSRSLPKDHAERRSRGIFQGTASGLVGRILDLLVTIASIPLAIRYLGGERYGAWVTIASVLGFLSFSDFGLGASLTNALGKTEAEDARDLGRRYVSSAILVLSLIGVLVLVFGILLSPLVASFLFPSLQSQAVHVEAVVAVAIALSIFGLNFPLLVTPRILAAYQEMAFANLWNMARSLANLVALLAVIWFRGGLGWLVFGCLGLGWIINLISTIWLLVFHKPWLRPKLDAVDSAFVKNLFSDGWKFFFINAGWVINSQTDNMVIAHYLGPAQVTPYAITFGLFTVATVLQTLVYPSLWPAYTEAFAKRDYDWIRRTIRSNFKFSFITSLVVVSVLTIFGSPIIRFWAGEVAVPPFALVVWMAVWRLMLSTLLVGSCLLNATGHLKGMTIYGSVTAILNLILSILLVRVYGIVGVIAGTVFAFAIANYIPTFIEVRNVLRKFSPALEMA
ncbi:MAG TPA: oligosaccharide flippase family protein [Chthoniobacterales bacterium]|nr:oligosaccharide flippase family protein [Chthoniobacterales bacterium]